MKNHHTQKENSNQTDIQDQICSLEARLQRRMLMQHPSRLAAQISEIKKCYAYGILTKDPETLMQMIKEARKIC